ncbi:hypothetical protein IFM89_026978 [Coptis chinensis]|uniref:Uncharacterized protein n=1 Tax=Coptis chinensis TaxID=261450 RepID=A0A835H6A4_9MAGN|nr:hypothetical protein IFM89_026978 [Coptis chinensis]
MPNLDSSNGLEVRKNIVVVEEGAHQEPTVKTIGFDFTLLLLLYKDDRVSVVVDMGGRNPSKAYGQDNSDGMGTAEWRAAKSLAYYKRGDYVHGLKKIHNGSLAQMGELLGVGVPSSCIPGDGGSNPPGSFFFLHRISSNPPLYSQMIGLTIPTSGTAFIQGMDIRTDMNKIYTSMGVCPQHDLLWEKLTGREHLLFYGRLKNLKGSALTQVNFCHVIPVLLAHLWLMILKMAHYTYGYLLRTAVEESLKNFNLFHGGVGDKRTHKYSGGMKRRLSVAISLIGDRNSELDPASPKPLMECRKASKAEPCNYSDQRVVTGVCVCMWTGGDCCVCGGGGDCCVCGGDCCVCGEDCCVWWCVCQLVVCVVTGGGVCGLSVIKKKYGQDATNVGDEGGFAPNIQLLQTLSIRGHDFDGGGSGIGGDEESSDWGFMSIG